MMIVKERRISAVFAAFAWIALVYLWQAEVLLPPSLATADSPAREEVTLASARHGETRD